MAFRSVDFGNTLRPRFADRVCEKFADTFCAIVVEPLLGLGEQTNKLCRLILLSSRPIMKIQAGVLSQKFARIQRAIQAL